MFIGKKSSFKQLSNAKPELKTYLISNKNGQTQYPLSGQNRLKLSRILWSRTYLYNPYKEVSPLMFTV